MPAPLAGPLFTELEEGLSAMPRKQQVLARTILETPELVALGSVRDLADQLSMNSATIIRFAKGLGFSGYQGLQAAVREAYLARTGARASRAPLSDGATGVVGEAIARVRANLDVALAEAESPMLDAVAEPPEVGEHLLYRGVVTDDGRVRLPTGRVRGHGARRAGAGAAVGAPEAPVEAAGVGAGGARAGAHLDDRDARRPGAG